MANLRDVLGDDHYEVLGRTGRAMTNATWRPTHLSRSTSCARTTERRRVAMNAGAPTGLSRSCSPISRGRPGAGKPTPTRCARRSRPTMPSYGMRSRHTTAGCSSTPVTGSVRCSRRRVQRWTRPSPHSAARTPGTHGPGHRRGRTSRRRLLRRVLNRAARVMAAGHGGQILIDGTTAELLTELTSLPWVHATT